MDGWGVQQPQRSPARWTQIWPRAFEVRFPAIAVNDRGVLLDVVSQAPHINLLQTSRFERDPSARKNGGATSQCQATAGDQRHGSLFARNPRAESIDLDAIGGAYKNMSHCRFPCPRSTGSHPSLSGESVILAHEVSLLLALQVSNVCCYPKRGIALGRRCPGTAFRALAQIELAVPHAGCEGSPLIGGEDQRRTVPVL